MTNNQITQNLPKEKWQSVTITENNDPIISMQPSDKIILGQKEISIRISLVSMLELAANNLPEDICLYIIEGIRSIEDQKKSWDRSYEKIKIEFPNENASFWEQQTGLLVARPLPLANHNCGGAVDVCLIFKNSGEFLDMGTPAQSGFEYSLTQMFSNKITETQKENRKLLREAMEQAGFVWYPGEWWHYCYGDRMWAVYTNRSECFYGPIQNIRG